MPAVSSIIAAVAAAAGLAGSGIAAATAPDEKDLIRAQKEKTPEQRAAYESFLKRRAEAPLGTRTSPFAEAAEAFSFGNTGNVFASNPRLNDLNNKIQTLKAKQASKMGQNPFF